MRLSVDCTRHNVKRMNRIKELREKAGLTQAALGDRAGTTAATIQRLETGQRQLTQKWANIIAHALSIEVTEIFGNIIPAHRTGLKVLGMVQAGVWRESETMDEEPFPPLPIAPDPRFQEEAQFALMVRGKSMNKIIKSGEFIVCVSWREIRRGPRDGDLVVVERRRDGLVEATVKRVQLKGQKLYLMPESTDPRWQTPLELQLDSSLENDEIVVTALVIGRYEPLG